MGQQMKPGIPWSVKGIEPETREAAKDAARRSGMTLGEWLNSKILDSAENAEPEEPSMSRHLRPAERRDETSIRLEDIAEQLSRIARRDHDTAPARATYSAHARSEESEAFSKILNRVESNERQTVEAFTAVNERLAVLGRQFAQATKAVTAARPEEPAAFKSLETAVRNIVEHIEVSEKRTRDSLKSMQDRMAEMAQRAMSANSEQVIQSAPAFNRLESRLSELAGRVEKTEVKSDFALPEILRKELSQLTDRIETVRESAEQLASKAQTAAVQTSQAELREIEKRILSLLKEAQTAFAGNGGSNAEMQRLRTEIGSINQRIDSARADTASERDVHALRIAVEQLSTRVAQGSDMRPLADMDRRLVDITQRLEQSQNSSRYNPQLGELERRMVELDHRLNDAIRLQGDGHAQSALEEKISEVADRVGRTENQLGHLETIERAINQLYESIEQSRNWAKDVAEDAANRMADRLMSAAPATAVPIAASPELLALEDGLRAVRESAIGADKRNQETLEAVHETLEQIVTKLAELEMSAVGQQVAAAVANQANPMVAPAAEPPDFWQAAPSISEHPGSAYEPRQADVQPELDNPFVSAAAEAQPNPMEDWLANSKMDASPNFSGQGFGGDDAPADDFIAAARRAAQAASQKGIMGSLTPGATKSGKSGLKGLAAKFLFRKAESKPATVGPGGEKLPPEIQPAANPNTNMRRTLLLAGLVILAAVSAFTVKMMDSPKPRSAMAPASVERSIAPVANPVKEIALAPENSVTSTVDPLLSNQGNVFEADGILTGSLPVKKPDSTLNSIVAEPSLAANDSEMPDPELGTEALRIAAKNGDTAAQFIVATRYFDGEGVAQDVTKAAYWYQKAASLGSAPAQYRLATLFERGRGVPSDAATALVWYQRAAEQGNLKAMHNAAVIAAGAEAGKPNYDIAFKWFLAAGQNGLKDSQFNLAVLYERGLGTKADSSEALFWYMIAAGQNDADAQKRVDILSKSLTPTSLASISAKVKSWVPSQTPENANVVTIKDPAWQSNSSLSKIESPSPVSEILSSTQNSVGLTQELLTKLGFNIGEPDGKVGTRTTNAIRLFQLQSGLKVTGEVTEQLISQLQAKLG
jgi:localization factor PodJL